MIQDIQPHQLDNTYANIKADHQHVCFSFKKGEVLLHTNEEGSFVLPTLEQLDGVSSEKAIYIFSVDQEPMFLIPEKDLGQMDSEKFQYHNIRDLYKKEPIWGTLAAVTANHLNHWYKEHQYCGCCGAGAIHSRTERAMICPQCKNIQYPRISPVIMAAITNGDKLLVTRYADRPYKGLALIAGFVEIGESLEGCLKREVMEEVGLKIKNLRYFGSQPWGFSDSVISGFFAELDGSDEIRLDRDELSEALWLSREEIPEQALDMSITANMIEAFRKGEEV